MSRRLAALALTAISAAGFAAALTATYRGMRELMVESSVNGRAGFCVRGGAYEIASECSQAPLGLLLGGIVAALLFGALLLGFIAWGGGPRLGAFTLAGAAFVALGWNFLDLGLAPPGEDGTVAGWVASGVVFMLMAVAFFAPALWRAAAWIRRGGAPERPPLDPDLVAAAIGRRPGSARAPAGGGSTPSRLVSPDRSSEAGQ